MRPSRLAVVTVAAGVLAGCSSGHGAAKDQATPSSSATTTGSAQGWLRPDLTAVSQPVAVGSAIDLFVVAGEQLSVVGLDGATGKTLWTDPASPSDIAPGEPFGLVVAQGNVIYLSGRGGDTAQLVAADGVTGAVKWTSPTGRFNSQPLLCPDSTTTLCMTGSLEVGGVPGTILRVSLADGSVLPGTTLSTSQPGRALGEGIYDPEERNPERVVASTGAAVGWSKPLSAIFPAAGSSSDWGWNFDRIPRVGLFVGFVGVKPSRTGTTYRSDMSAITSAGFRIADGTVVWRSPGTQYLCGILLCPGGRQRNSELAGPAQPQPTIGVRLRAKGTAIAKEGSTKPTVSANASGVLEGFDLSTGKVLWTYAAGRNVDLLTGALSLKQADENSLVLAGARGYVALNLTTGAANPAPAQVWCRGITTYVQDGPFQGPGGTRLKNYVGESSLFPCNPNGVRARVPAVVPVWLADIGAKVGGLVAWSTGHGVQAAPVS